MNRAQRRLQMANVNKRFRMERNSVLRSLDVKMMDAFFIRWKAPLPTLWATDKPDAQLACMHYARIQCPDMTEKERYDSATWLVANTYGLPSGYQIVGNKLTFTKPNREAGPNFGMEGPDGN